MCWCFKEFTNQYINSTQSHACGPNPPPVSLSVPPYHNPGFFWEFKNECSSSPCKSILRIVQGIFSSSGHPRWMSLFLHQNWFGGSLAHQWILYSEWVPSEWESKLLIKTSHNPPPASPSFNIVWRQKLSVCTTRSHSQLVTYWHLIGQDPWRHFLMHFSKQRCFIHFSINCF